MKVSAAFELNEKFEQRPLAKAMDCPYQVGKTFARKPCPPSVLRREAVRDKIVFE